MSKKHDKLDIELKGKTLDFEIEFGYIDRIHSQFNFSTGKNEEISGYSVCLNPEQLSAETLKELEEISNQLNKFFNITLSLDGLTHRGKAKIARSFGIGCYNLDLELHSN